MYSSFINKVTLLYMYSVFLNIFYWGKIIHFYSEFKRKICFFMTLIFSLSFLVGQQVYAHENKTQMDTVTIDGVKYLWEENTEELH